METSLILISNIKCPECGFTKDEKMSENSCLWYYECHECKTLLRPESGDCCVFCSFGSVKCPPVQSDGLCCN